MSRRTVSGLLAAVLLVLLFAVAAFVPVPYVAMSPGPTVDVLGKAQGREIVRVDGHKTYPTTGDLRLVTVSVTSPDQQLSLAAALSAWFDKTRAVYPRDVFYPKDKSVKDVETESSVEMVSSQDSAVAAALTELGYQVSKVVEVLSVNKGSPADGRLRTRDRILSVNGHKITATKQVTAAIQKTGVRGEVDLLVRRGGKAKHVMVRPTMSDQAPKHAVVGVVVGPGFVFPFDVSVNISDAIGGPSAGLIFSLAVYDTLTPGSLTGGVDMAGTGTITEDGKVGPIGGIAQKIVAADDAGAKIFLVPPQNCAAALGADVKKGEITLVKAPTMHSAVHSIKAYVKDRHADLPRCG